MSTSGGGPVQAGPYYVYVLNTGVVGCHQTPDRRLHQHRRKEGKHVKMVWVSKPFPDRQDAEEHSPRLRQKRDSEPLVFLRMCECEDDQTDKPDLLMPRKLAAANP